MKKQSSLVFSAIILLGSVYSFGCSKAQESYYPLKEGQTREYLRVDIKKGDKTKLMHTNLGTRDLQGKLVTPIKIESEEKKFGLRLIFIGEDRDGIYLLGDQGEKDIEPIIDEKPHYIIKFPTKTSKTWQNEEIKRDRTISPSAKCIIESDSETITVLAGTFINCIKIKTIIDSPNVKYINWYAPSIGLVKSIYYNEQETAEFMTQLISYKK